MLHLVEELKLNESLDELCKKRIAAIARKSKG